MATVTIENTHHRKAVWLTLQSDNGDQNLLAAHVLTGRKLRKLGRAYRDSIQKDRVKIEPGDYLVFAGEKDEDGHYDMRFQMALDFARMIDEGRGGPDAASPRDVSFLTATIVE